MASAPSLTASFTEPVRLGFEIWSLLGMGAPLALVSPRGEGQPVMVLPGFGAHDETTLLLRTYLDLLGYKTYGWNNGVNTGPSHATIDHLKQRLEDVHARHDRPVALIGHSLGGIYARELARAFPDKVDRVITLGTPFGLANNPHGALKAVQRIFEWLNPGASTAHEPALVKNLLNPPPVPTTSLYSSHDGVVERHASFNPPSPLAENIEIGLYASHIGLVANPGALAVIAERLAEPRDAWQPFSKARAGLLGAYVPCAQAHENDLPAAPHFTDQDRASIARAAPQLGLLAA